MASAKYKPPYGSSDPNAGYQNGDAVLGTPGSIADARAWEWTQREIINAIIAAGITPDGDLFNQLAAAIAANGASSTTINNTINNAPVNAFVAPSASNSIPSGVSTKLTAFGTIVNNIPAVASWNAGTSRLTFAKACWADVGMRLDTNLPVGGAGGYGFSTNFGKNGVNISLGGRNGITNSSAFLGPFGADKSFEYFSIGDYIEFFAGHNYGSNLNFPVRCTVEIKGV